MSFGNRGAADELARLLDGVTADGSGAALSTRLSGAGMSSAAASGAALAGRLRATGAALDASVAPRAEFRAALRTRLVAVATVQAAAPAVDAVPAASPPARALEAAVSWSTARRAQRGTAVAAGALASVVAVSGVAVAGSQSLPGDPFYGVKRTTEALQLRTADGDVEKGTRHLDFAATRLREVRGLTLGRDALTSGPQLGTAALSGVALRSAQRPLADGAPLGPAVADRVRATLAEMDDQTREGTALLTGAYRASRATEPLRALSRFATRQSEGLEQLIPALPESAQPRAQESLALVTGVAQQASGLLAIGVCGDSCDPSTAAPTVPAPPAAPGTTTGTSTEAPCVCEEPTPAPAPQASAEPVQGTQEPAPAPEPEPEPADDSGSPSPTPSASPSPSPSPSSSAVPLPLPVPVPTVPLPVPTITLPPLEPGAITPTLAPLSGPAPEPANAPLPAPVEVLAPVPTRP